MRKERGERRKHKRFRDQSGAFVGIGPHFNKVCRLIDIGMGGLSFRYMAREKRPNVSFLDIFLTDRDFYSGYVPCEISLDFEMANKEPFDSITIR